MKLRSLMTVICVLATATIVSAAPFAYVANSGTKNVTVIDTADNTIKATVPLPDTQQTIHPFAYSIAVGASGQYVYVGLQNTNEVAVIDAARKVVVKRISLGTDSPGGLAVNAAETRLYVASNLSDTLIVIDISGSGSSEVGRVTVDDHTISNPEGVVLNAAGNRAYVANTSQNSVSEISLDEVNNIYTRLSVTDLGAGVQPVGLALNTAGTKLYISSLSGSVKMMDTATKALTSLSVGNGTVTVAINKADNTKVYAPSNSLDKLYVINSDVVSGTQYTVAAGPYGSSVTPDGTKLYLTMNTSTAGETVKVFNTSTNSVDATIQLPTLAKPTSMGDFIGPDMPNTIDATNGSGCTILPVGLDIPVNNKGRKFTISATPGPCNVKVDDVSVGVGLTSYSFTNVTANHTIDASVAQYFTLTADWPAGGCYLVSTPQGTSPVGINAGSKTTTMLGGTNNVYIAAAPGYSPIGWTGACAGTADGSPCIIPVIDADKTFAVTTCGQAGGNVYNVTKGIYYATIAEATGAASDNDIIKVSTAVTVGETTGSGVVKVTMSGLWQSDYLTPGTGSLALTISGAAVIADGLTL